MSTLDLPLTLRSGARLPNRIGLAPLTNLQSAPDGTLGEDERRWLTRRAGRFGLVSTCAAYVSEEGKAWVGQLGVASDAHLPGLRRLAESLRSESVSQGVRSLSIVQLYHGGALASVAPVRLSTADGEGIRGADEADLARVVDDFAAAARRSAAAGFDGVEVHGANGYLFTQFLTPDKNPRRDRWGGALPGRARLLRETVRAVRAATPAGFVVGVRISPVDIWSRRGLLLADGAQVARWCAEDGADFVHLSLSTAWAPPPHEPGAPPVARAIRDALPPTTALVAAGGIWTRRDAERAASVGVDVVALGRAAIVHPDWPAASRRPDFTPTRQPWVPEALQAATVGPAMQDYLRRFPGAVVGGAPQR